MVVVDLLNLIPLLPYHATCVMCFSLSSQELVQAQPVSGNAARGIAQILRGDHESDEAAAGGAGEGGARQRPLDAAAARRRTQKVGSAQGLFDAG